MRASELIRGLGTVSSLTAVSRVLGLIRDAGMAVVFGAGPLMDAFTVAFRLPNMARRLFGEGALTAAFLPVFVRESAVDPTRGRELAWAVTLQLALVLTALTLLIEAVALGLLLTTESAAETVLRLTAILTPYLVFICVAAQLSAVLHAMRRFFWPAVLPLILNGCWIAAIASAPRIASGRRGQIEFIAVVICLSGILQVGLLVGVLRSIGFGWVLRPGRSRDATREIAAAIAPTVVGLSITQLNAVADSVLAWGLSASSGIPESLRLVESGSATALYLGQRVHQVPLGIFGIALSTVLFPAMTEHAQRGRTDRLGHELTRGLQLCLIVGIPASLGLILLASEIPALLFEYGKFTTRDSALTARMLAGYGLGVWAFMALPIATRGFFAVGDRRTPVRVGLGIVAAHLAFDLIAVVVFGGAGLAVATSLAAMIQLVVVAALLHRRVAPLAVGPIVRVAARVAAATIAMAAACRLTQSAIGEAPRVVAVIGPVLVSIAIYAGVAFALGLHRVAFASPIGERETPLREGGEASEDR